MFKNSFSFNGRIRRTEFGISYLLCIILLYGSMGLMEAFNLGGYQVIVILGALYWFQFAQGAKRCHDLGNNGFYQIIPFYIFAMIFSEGENRNNKYGEDPKIAENPHTTLPPTPETNKLILPKGKSIEAIGSELMSGILLTAFAIALASYFLGTDGWVYFIIESILIMTGYFTILLLHFKSNPLPRLPLYFIVHRAIFSVVCYLVICVYEIYSNNINNLDFSAIGGDILYVLSIFILTYPPYLFYKTRKIENPIPLEA